MTSSWQRPAPLLTLAFLALSDPWEHLDERTGTYMAPS